MKSYEHLLLYLAEFFLEWTISDKVVEKIKSRIVYSITFSLKSCCLWDNVKNYVTARQATYDNVTWPMRFACWITEAADTQS